MTRIVIDAFGIPWPANPHREFCPVCWQPAIRGACSHEPLSFPRIVEILKGIPVGDGSTTRPVLSEDLEQMKSPSPIKVLGTHLIPVKKPSVSPRLEPLPANTPQEKARRRRRLRTPPLEV